MAVVHSGASENSFILPGRPSIDEVGECWGYGKEAGRCGRVLLRRGAAIAAPGVQRALECGCHRRNKREPKSSPFRGPAFDGRIGGDAVNEFVARTCFPLSAAFGCCRGKNRGHWEACLLPRYLASPALARFGRVPLATNHWPQATALLGGISTRQRPISGKPARQLTARVLSVWPTIHSKCAIHLPDREEHPMESVSIRANPPSRRLLTCDGLRRRSMGSLGRRRMLVQARHPSSQFTSSTNLQTAQSSHRLSCTSRAVQF